VVSDQPLWVATSSAWLSRVAHQCQELNEWI
jgi:hypothetical protein